MSGESQSLSPLLGKVATLMDHMATSISVGATTEKAAGVGVSNLGAGMPSPKNNKRLSPKARKGGAAGSRKQNLYDLTEALNALVNAINAAGKSEGVEIRLVADSAQGNARREFVGLYTCPNCGRLVLDVLGVTHESKCIERKKNGPQQ